MRRVLVIILSLFIFTLYPMDYTYGAYNEDLPETLQVEDEPDPILPNIFIWQIPDDDIEPAEVTLDESENEAVNENEPTEEELYYANYDNVPLKGYLDFIEDTNAISLKKPDKEMVLNLSIPQKLTESKLSDKDKIPKTTFAKHVYSKSSDNIQYNIAPFNDSHEITHKGFSLGTSYNESIDTSDLGFTTSLYSKYENKYFALKTSYDKNAGVSYSNIVDKFSFAPELKLNRYVSIKDVITSDITRNRKKNEVILSIKPTADDRVRFEFGAGQTFDSNNELMRTQVKFSTQYKW